MYFLTEALRKNNNNNNNNKKEGFCECSETQPWTPRFSCTALRRFCGHRESTAQLGGGGHASRTGLHSREEGQEPLGLTQLQKVPGREGQRWEQPEHRDPRAVVMPSSCQVLPKRPDLVVMRLYPSPKRSHVRDAAGILPCTLHNAREIS